MPARCDSPSAAAEEPRLEIVSRLTPELQTRVNTLAVAARAADHGVAPFGEHKWLRLTRGDADSTALLLWQGSDLVAAAHCDVFALPRPGGGRRLAAEVVVHPGQRNAGLGRRLIDEVAALARRRGAAEVHVWAYGNAPAAQRLADAYGFVAERTLLQMVLPWEKLPGPPDLPPELRVRAFDPPGDAYRWLALHNHVFASHPEQSQWDALDLQVRLEQPWFRPADLLLIESIDNAELLGFCWVKLPLEVNAPGEIYNVGVAPDARGQGLGRLVTQAGLAHIGAAGRAAMLYVEAANRAAVELYTGLGFEPRWQHVCYSRRLTGG